MLGKTFARPALGALSGLDEAQVEPLLASLVRKEVLGVQADARSPEHGQYGFLQDLVRHVAYETLSKRERQREAPRRRASTSPRTSPGSEDEVVEVIASHYLDAYEALPDAEDAPEIKRQARETLARAGERAASLAAAEEARRYFEQACGLADEPLERASLLDRAGEMATRSADPEAARELFEEAIALFEAHGDTHAAARAAGALGHSLAFTGRRDEALARMERAFDVISADEPDEDLALLAGRLALTYWFSGNLERAAERSEFALDIAEAHRYMKPLVVGLRGRAAVAWSRGHSEEALAISKRGLELALENDLAEDAQVSYFILSDTAFRDDRYAEALAYLEQALALARKLGDRPHEWAVLAESSYPLYMLGSWDEALNRIEEPTEEQTRSGGVLLSLLTSLLEIHLHRGRLDAARHVFSLFAHLEGSSDVQDRSCFLSARSSLNLAEKRLPEALADAEAAIEATQTLGWGQQAAKQAFVTGLEAALVLGEHDRARELMAPVERAPAGMRAPFLDAQAHRFRARLDGDEAGFEAAERLFAEVGLPFWLAVVRLEHGELLAAQDRPDEAAPLLAEARETFERLQATPWLERARQASPEGREPEPVAG